MGEAIPPAGAERDAELAEALGRYLTRDDGSSYEDVIAGCSTDPAACARLVEEMVGISHITGKVVTVHRRIEYPELGPNHYEHRIAARYALTLCGARIYQPEETDGDWLRRLDDGPRLRECPACRADFPVTAETAPGRSTDPTAPPATPRPSEP